MLKNNALKKIAFGFLLSTTLGHASNYGDEESNQYYPSSRIREEEYRPRQEEEKYPKFSVESMESFLNNWNKEYKETLDDTSEFSKRASGLLKQYGEFFSSFIKDNGTIRGQVSQEEFSNIFLGLCGKNDPAVLAKFLLVLHPEKFISFASENNSWLLGQFIAGTFKTLPKNEKTTELSLNILDVWSESVHNKEHENRQANERSQEMQNQIYTLEQEKKNLERGRQVLLQELEAEKGAYSSYQYATEAAEKRAEELDQKVNDLNERISVLENELESKAYEIESLEAKLQLYKEQHEGICRDIAEKEAELINLYTTNKDLNTKNIRLNEENDTLKEEICQKDMTIKNQENVILDYENKLGKSAFELLMQEKDKTVKLALNDRIEELQNEKARLEDKISKLEESKNEYEGQMLSKSVTFAELEKEKAILGTELGHTRSKLEEQKEEIEKLEHNKNQSDLRIKELEGKVLHLNNELDKKMAESSYEETVKLLFEKIEGLQANQSEGFRSLGAIMSDPKLSIPEDTKEIERLKAELQTRDNRLAELVSELEQSANRNKGLESRVEELELDNYTKEEKIGLMESEYDKKLESKDLEINGLNQQLLETQYNEQTELEKLREELRLSKELNKNFIEKLKKYENPEKPAEIEKVEVKKEEVPVEEKVEEVIVEEKPAEQIIVNEEVPAEEIIVNEELPAEENEINIANFFEQNQPN